MTLRSASRKSSRESGLFGGTVIIAIMVMAAFANVANAGGCSYSKSKSAEATTEEIKDIGDKKAEVEAL